MVEDTKAARLAELRKKKEDGMLEQGVESEELDLLEKEEAEKATPAK